MNIKELVEEAVKTALNQDKVTRWHIEAEHVMHVGDLLKKHAEIDHHAKDPAFSSIHHFIVTGTKAKALSVVQTIHRDHNDGASATIKPYIDYEESDPTQHH